MAKCTYTPELGAHIAGLLARGMTFEKIAARDDTPSRDTLRVWRRDNVGGISALLAHAGVDSAEHHVELSRKALDVDLEALSTDNPRIISSAVNLASKQSDWHKWYAGKMDAKWSDAGDLATAFGAAAAVLFSGLAGPSASMPAPAPTPRLPDGDSTA